MMVNDILIDNFHNINFFEILRFAKILPLYATVIITLLYTTDCPQKITIGLSASIAFKIVNQSEYSLGL